MKGLLIIAAVLFSSIAQGQIVPSSCIAHDSIVEKYQSDADRLSLRKFFRNELSYKDSIQIPKPHSDTVLNALLAVYNAVTIPERDTVVMLYDIHTYPEYMLDEFIVSADSNLIWMEQLQSGNLITGNGVVDTLITNYNLTIKDYNVYSLVPFHSVVFKSQENLNLFALTDSLDTIVGVYNSYPEAYVGDGNNIWDSIHNDHVELVYSIGWGDCPSMCIYRRYWKFNVTFDCNVEFVESYGDDVSMSIPNQLGQQLTKVLPNPFTYYVKIEGVNQFDYQLFSSTGQLVIQGSTSNGEVRELEWLDSGIYFLRVVHENHNYMVRLVKS